MKYKFLPRTILPLQFTPHNLLILHVITLLLIIKSQSSSVKCPVTRHGYLVTKHFKCDRNQVKAHISLRNLRNSIMQNIQFRTNDVGGTEAKGYVILCLWELEMGVKAWHGDLPHFSMMSLKQVGRESGIRFPINWH